MRLFLLSETLDPVAKYGNQARSVASKLGIDSEELLSSAINSDPSPRKEYVGWILTQVRRQQLRLPEDSYRIKISLSEFHRLKQLGLVQIEKDVQQYDDLANLEDAIESVSGAKSKREGGTGGTDPLSLPGVSLYREGGPYKIYRVTDADSLAELGEGTKWCTRRSYPDCQAASYLEDYRLLYVVFKNGQKFAQYTPNFDQVTDAHNKYLKPDRQLTRLMEPELPDSSYNVIKLAYFFALRVVEGRWPKGEPVIARARNPEVPSWYASNVVGGRWPEGEPIIATQLWSAYYYARDVIKGRWPEVEPMIAQDPRSAYYYARDVIKGRWPEAESIIAKSRRWASVYRRDVYNPRCAPQPTH